MQYTGCLIQTKQKIPGLLAIAGSGPNWRNFRINYNPKNLLKLKINGHNKRTHETDHYKITQEAKHTETHMDGFTKVKQKIPNEWITDSETSSLEWNAVVSNVLHSCISCYGKPKCLLWKCLYAPTVYYVSSSLSELMRMQTFRGSRQFGQLSWIQFNWIKLI